MTVVDLAEDGVLLQDLVAGGEHGVGIEEPAEEEMAPLGHDLAERGIVAEKAR